LWTPEMISEVIRDETITTCVWLLNRKNNR
jgi:hypothetical protein